MTIAVVDTNAVYAAVDVRDRHHDAAAATSQRRDLRFVVPAMVVAEATYLVAERLGPRMESQFLRSLESVDVEGPTPEDFVRMGELVEQYSDFPLGGTDASVIALAERLDAPVVVTLDRRHFGTVTPRHRPAFELLP
ncbi:MAG TPA: PIN domain-containing protein [Solirubrobacteraceae bacterium]|nr:PIN domain-containing protein [Solirubrobacteraceae bacterium]